MRKGESVAQSVIVAQNIISDYPTISDLSEGPLTGHGVIQALEELMGLVSRVIGNIE
jgi:hypothetical protein